MSVLTVDQKIERRAAVNRTARLRIGAKVPTVERLAELAEQKRSVYVANSWGLLPAVVVMNMPAVLVCKAIKRGCVFYYDR